MINYKCYLDVAELFQTAGEKAISFTAFDEAFKYFNSRIDLLSENS